MTYLGGCIIVAIIHHWAVLSSIVMRLNRKSIDLARVLRSCTSFLIKNEVDLFDLPALLRAWFVARVLTAPCPYKLETSSPVFQSHRICPKTFGPITTPRLVAHPLLHSRDNSISPIPFFSDTTTDESNNEILPSSNGTRPVTRRKSDCKLNPVFCPHISS